jgi:hypothetical protein
MSAKRSQKAFDSLWEGVIAPALEAYVREGKGVTLRKNARNDIWTAYSAFNRHASNTYMRNPGGLLDRHKVAACYTLSILLAMPLLVEGEHEGDHLNERVSLHCGLSVLASFLTEAVKRAPGFTDEARKKALERITQGVIFPDPVGHGDSYVQSVLNCLAFTQIEQQYNVLMLALLYYDWELLLMDFEDHRLVVEYYIETNGNTSKDNAKHATGVA